MSQELKDIIKHKVQIALMEGCKHTGDKQDEDDADEEEVEKIEEMSRRRGAVIGALLGGPVGAAYGFNLAKGSLRTLDDKVRAAEKKVQDWSKDPKNKEKIEKKRQQITKWKAEIVELKKKGKGEAGGLRTSNADVEYNRGKAEKMKKELKD